MTLNYYYLTTVFPNSVEKGVNMNAGILAPFIESFPFFMMVYLLSVFGNHHPKLLSIIFFIRLAFIYRKTFILLFAILLGIGGILIEDAMTQVNLVHYREPEIFGVPYWIGGV